MHSLYVDSSLGLVLGILDEKYSWIEYLVYDHKKPSEIIHHEIYQLLLKHGLNLFDLQIFVNNGPGSYTGMRLGEGLAQVFEAEQIPVYSFYHFEVPKLLNKEKGFFVTNAFKNQLFIYSWDQQEIKKELIAKSDFIMDANSDGFTLDVLDQGFENLVSTKNLIKEKSEEIFSIVKLKKLRNVPYYFRSLSEEFF